MGKGKKSRVGKGKKSKHPPALDNPRLKRLKGSFRDVYIFYRSEDLEDSCSPIKSCLLKISKEDIELFSEVDCSSPITHDHFSAAGDKRFKSRLLDSTFLTYINGIPDSLIMGNAAVVESVVYAVYNGKLLTLNLNYKPPYPNCFQTLKQVPAPPSYLPGRDVSSQYFQFNHELLPKLISLRGRLYHFGGTKPFGEVFNPTTKSWSALKEPDSVVDSTKCMNIFRTSLGESNGEILVYGLTDKDNKYKDVTGKDVSSFYTIYIYNVDSDQWRSFTSSEQLDSAVMSDWFVLANPVVKEPPNNNNNITTTLYWMDRYGTLYAFDWVAEKFSNCRISGMDNEELNRAEHYYYSFCHLYGDLFCILWSGWANGRNYVNAAAYHITFFRVIEDKTASSLTANVVGCIEYFDENHHFLCFDVVRV